MITCPCCHRPMEGHTAPADALTDLPMQPQHRRVVEALVRSYPRFVTVETLIDALYSDDPSGGPLAALNVLRSRVCTLRKALKPHGWSISKFGYGTQGRYRLEPAGANTERTDG